MNLSADQIKTNWDKLISTIKDTFEEGSERREKLLKMYHYFEERMMFAPGSGKIHYHNAFPGGYVDHILNVIRTCLRIHQVYKDMGMKMDYTEKEVIFCAMHHDLGKIGDLKNEYYIPNESEWHRKNQGKIYNHNDKLHYMNVTDRTFWLLQHFGVTISEHEFLGIKLADGLYEEGNERYYKTYIEGNELKSNLPYLIHNGDLLATRMEHERYMYSKESSIDYTKLLFPDEVTEEEEEVKKDSVQLFDDLFSKVSKGG